MAWSADKVQGFAQEIIGWGIVHIHKHAENKYSIRRWNSIDDWFPDNLIETLHYVENWCDENDCNLSMKYENGKWIVSVAFSYIAIDKYLTNALITVTLSAHEDMMQSRKVWP